MTKEAASGTERIRWSRVLVCGLAAGAIINAFEYGGHGLFLDDAWTKAFHALGKTPKGWSTFIPANFWVGILTVWLYAYLRRRHHTGPKTALRAGSFIWVVFWVIPMLALMPMDLFPDVLLIIVIALGLLDMTIATLAGAWLYEL